MVWRFILLKKITLKNPTPHVHFSSIFLLLNAHAEQGQIRGGDGGGAPNHLTTKYDSLKLLENQFCHS